MNWSQLRAMLWLRWRLSRNQSRRGGHINSVIGLILLMVGLGLIALGGIAGVVGGVLGLSEAGPRASMVVFDGLIAAFLLFWTIGLVAELQQSELLDLRRLMHLPVSLRDVFLLNYLASHLSFSLALMLPAMLGVAVGLVAGRGAAMLLLFPLVFGFFFMVTAWTYHLRGWLASLMVNKRRRQAIIMGVTLAFFLMFQLPNLVTNVWMRGRQGEAPKTEAEMEAHRARAAEEQAAVAAVYDVAHRVVPLLWLPQGAKSLAEGRVWPAILGALGMMGIGTWGLARAYWGTVGFYQGREKTSFRPVASAAGGRRGKRKLLVERALPAIPEEASALAMAIVRSMSRAPEVKMALVTNIVIFAFIGFGAVFRRPGNLPVGAQGFVASGVVAVTFMGLTQLMFNHFGFDRSGFRALVLLPAPRHYLLLGKNIALGAIAAVVFGIYLLMASIVADLGIVDVLAACLEFVAAFLAMSVLGNLASIFVPYRVAAGSLKSTKRSVTTTLMIFVVHVLSMAALLPVFLPAWAGLMSGMFGWLPREPATLLCAALLASLSALLYWGALEPSGRLLEGREKKVLEVVTQEVE